MESDDGQPVGPRWSRVRRRDYDSPCGWGRYYYAACRWRMDYDSTGKR
jgi:hypothetical protein